MKRLLRKGLCLAFGLACVPAQAQELNFRAVAPPKAAVNTTVIPVSLTRPMPAASDGNLVFRGKINEEPTIVGAQEAMPRFNAPRLAQGKEPTKYNPLPPGPNSDFIAPPPQIITAPPGATTGIIVQPQTSSPVVVGSPSSTMWGGGGGLFDGLIAEDPYSCNACGTSCNTCDPQWHPFERIHSLFSGCGCNSGCCDPRTPLWIRGEYLLWDVSRQHIPPLATRTANGSGNFNQLPLNAGSIVTYGDDQMNDQIQNGGRITMGLWFPRHSNWGLDASYMFLGNRSQHFSDFSTGTPAIGRPYIDTSPIVRARNGTESANPRQNQETVERVADTTGAVNVAGNINIDSSTQIWGVDANLRRKLYCSSGFWLDGLIGYRHFQLEDYVRIQENVNVGFGNPLRTQNSVQDSFATTNSFNGLQLGIEGEWRFRRRWTLGGSLKVAAGNVHQVVTINGSTTALNRDGTQQTQVGGLLAQRSNIGTYAVDRLAVLPEVGVKLGFDVTDHLRLYAGYNLMYLSNVVRAGEQIDRRVNSSQFAFSPPNFQPGTLVGPANPSVLFQTAEFWAQGANFGLEWHY